MTAQIGGWYSLLGGTDVPDSALPSQIGREISKALECCEESDDLG